MTDQTKPKDTILEMLDLIEGQGRAIESLSQQLLKVQSIQGRTVKAVATLSKHVEEIYERDGLKIQ